MGDFPYIDHLARLYKQKGEESGNWTDYLKVKILKQEIVSLIFLQCCSETASYRNHRAY